MLKEAKNIDFYTTGREPSSHDFSRISEWIRKKKSAASRVTKKSLKRRRSSATADVPPIEQKKD